MSKQVTADAIAQYLDGRDDFDLELFAYRSLKGRGWTAVHGGSYPDPLQPNKLRQYDVRARKDFGVQQRVSFGRELSLAVESRDGSALPGVSTMCPFTSVRRVASRASSTTSCLTKTFMAFSTS